MKENKRPESMIEIEHLDMKFYLTSERSQSLKEYLIRELKRENRRIEFYALKDINLRVFRGEILGIVGTNGSGKSTLLKLIAGALTPTAGKIQVDRTKVQLLTLGSGFDGELTAKENLYLNGALIGYSKEFLDKNYEAIVAFAELEGFMNEKMKNFSSGMVSRLGFAIATAEDSAEILILDEVLSVGDLFFRKKSEARIREMMHNGATVILVSHSIDTILNNCTRAVWLEKGVLKMEGDVTTICKAYQNFQQ